MKKIMTISVWVAIGCIVLGTTLVVVTDQVVSMAYLVTVSVIAIVYMLVVLQMRDMIERYQKLLDKVLGSNKACLERLIEIDNEQNKPKL